MDGDAWTFEFAYAMGGDGGDKDGDGKGGDDDGDGGDKPDSDTCYEDCMAKGASESDCDAACGDGAGAK